MIYKFKDGPLDGGELDVPEMPIGWIYRHPIEEEIGVQTAFDPAELIIIKEVHYRVTDIGEMTLDHYKV